MNTPEKLQDLCEDYCLRQGINTDNCLFLLNFTDGAGLKLLFQESLDFCLDHFTQLTDSDDFVHLDKSLLIQLLQSDRLNVPDELFVLAAISKWLVANEADQQVVSAVRFSLIEEEELEKFDNKQLIELAINMNQSSGRAKENQRTPDRRERLVAVFGLDLCRYDPITNAWARMAKLPFGNYGLTLATLGDSLYLFCEYEILRFDLKNHTWHKDVAPMNEPRHHLAAVELNGCLYALGGLLGGRTVERYDALNNTWHLCAPMRQSRRQAATAVLDGRIYVAGGYRKKGSIDCYLPQENKWSYINNSPSLGWKGQVSSMVSFEGCLYLLERGGQFFKYQAESDVWKEFTVGRLLRDSCLHVLNGKLYANKGSYFHVLDRVIGDAEFRWCCREIQRPTSPKLIKFDLEYYNRRAIYYGLDCADPLRNFNQSSSRAKKNPRTPDRRERLVALFGPDLRRYDPITNAWARMSKPPELDNPLYYFTLATLGDSLYLLCGTEIWRFDLKHRTWHEDVAPWNKLCCAYRAVELNGSLYVLGDSWHDSTVVERYDALNNTWHLCAPMRELKSYPATAVLDGRIYIAGGRGSTPDECIECYRPQENTWSEISNPLSLGWTGQVRSMVSFEGCLYLLDDKSKVFKYQAESDVWEKFTEGRLPYEFLPQDSRLYVLNGKLYARVENYFHLLDQVIGHTEFRWWWRKMKTPTSPREIDFGWQDTHDSHHIYYGLDCADPPKND